MGKFICFCGLDASGKTTQAEKLRDFFKAINIEVHVVHGFKPLKHSKSLVEVAAKMGVKFYEYYTPELRSLSYVCDIIEKYIDYIKPLLDQDNYVISDKYKVESYIFAPILGCRPEIITPFIDILPNPDINIYIDILPELAYERLNKRIKLTGEQMSRKDSLDNMKKGKILFDEYCANTTNCYRIDGNGSIEEIHSNIVLLLKNLEFL